MLSLTNGVSPDAVRTTTGARSYLRLDTILGEAPRGRLTYYGGLGEAAPPRGVALDLKSGEGACLPALGLVLLAVLKQRLPERENEES